MAHLTQVEPAPEGRLIVTDNFYTRHRLGAQVRNITDGEVACLGTVRLNTVHKVNKRNIDTAIAQLSAESRGSWRLVQALHVAGSTGRRGEPAPQPTTIENAEYIVWKDRSCVIFFTNDLNATPTAPVMPPNRESESIVWGIVKFRRWMENECLHASVVEAPAPVMAYNMFMNGDERVDQLRSSNPTERRERMVPMSIFTFLLDESMLNAYALYHEMLLPPNDSRMDFQELKRTVAEALVAQRHGVPDSPDSAKMDSVPLTQHILTDSACESDGTKRVRCFLCSTRDMEKRVSTNFQLCGMGFHVNCFALYHHDSVFDRLSGDITEVLQQARGSVHRRRRKRRKENPSEQRESHRLNISLPSPSKPSSATQVSE